jgi:hypothetical protein
MNLDEVLAIFRATYADEWHAVHPLEWGEEEAHYYRIVYKARCGPRGRMG